MRLVRVHSTLAARSSAVCSALNCSHAASLGFLSLLGRDNLLLPGQSTAAVLGSIAVLFAGGIIYTVSEARPDLGSGGHYLA